VKKTIVIGVAVFIVSIAAGTGLRMALAPARGEGTPPEGTPGPGAHEATEDAPGTPAEGHADGAQEPEAHESVEATSEETEDDPGSSAEGMEFREVARILLNMERAEAVLLLSYLNDGQVLGILRSMRVRDAARVLAMLPEKRAASLSRRLLETKQENDR
jgi:hypothetical protein